MKRIIVICIIACCALAVASSPLFADGMGKCNFMPGHGSMCGKKADHEGMFLHKAAFILKNAAELGLSDEQVEKIKAAEYGLKKSTIKEDADIASLVLDIKEALRKDVVDLNAVNGLVDQKYVIKAQKAKEDIAAYANLKALLTKDQHNKLKEMWGTKGKAMMGHKGMHEEKE